MQEVCRSGRASHDGWTAVDHGSVCPRAYRSGDDAAGEEAHELVIVEAEHLAEDVLVVLAEGGCAADGGVEAVEADGLAVDGDGRVWLGRLFELLEVRGQAGVAVELVGDALDGGGGDAVRLQEIGGLPAILFARPRCDDGVERVFVGLAGGVGGEAGVVGEGGLADRVGELPELVVAFDGDGEPFLVAAGREDAVRRVVGIAVCATRGLRSRCARTPSTRAR